MSRRAYKGQRTIYGGIFTRSAADAYNAVSDKINQFESEGRTPPEHLLNGRFNLYISQTPEAQEPST